jgi:hypothetical protein
MDNAVWQAGYLQEELTFENISRGWFYSFGFAFCNI